MKRALTLSLVLVALGGTAHADKADALFKKAKKLLAEKRYPEACATFEEVDKTDPGIGAKLNVGKCYEEWGKLALAYRWYTDAEAMASATKDGRAPQIHALAEELDTNVPRLTVSIPEGANPDVVETILLDGKPLTTFGVEQRVDPGAHVLEMTIDGVAKKKVVPVERGGSSEISLDVPKGKGKGKGKKGSGWKTKKPEGGGDPQGEPAPDPEPEAAPVPGRTQRIAGIALGAGGVVAIGVAGAITLSARGKYKDALADHCMGSSSMCDEKGLDITRDARHRANIATVVTIVGGAAVIGGVVLYLVAPKVAAPGGEHALRITPVVGEDGAAVVLGGAF